MDIYEVTGYRTGTDNAGVNFLDPADAFEYINNGALYRQELFSRLGFTTFTSSRLDGAVADGTRVMGIFEFILPSGLKELLVITKKMLYKFNTVTRVFDQIPTSSAVPIADFAILANDAYVSGTAYPINNSTLAPPRLNEARFVFTGKGMSDVYFYDPSLGANGEVKRYTNVVDNPSYVAPASGALTNAYYLSWFGERLNFFAPTVGGLLQAQQILYSGIRNNSGAGDDYNTVGSGFIEADTYEAVRGMQILGDQIILNFQRSNWSLEKTRDPFNPYFIRRIPSVLGTDASFSSTQYNYEVKSMGKTGIIQTDGRQSLRTDNKIPYFTRDEIDEDNFELIYGGFDRFNSMFMFSYRSQGSQLNDITQDKVLMNNYEEGTWFVYDLRFSVFGQTDKGIEIPWSAIDGTPPNPASWHSMNTTEEIWNKIGTSDNKQKTLAGDDLGYIYELNQDFDDYYNAITGITQATSAAITVANHPFKTGDRVTFEDIEGMVEMNGLEAVVIGTAANTIIVNVNSTLFSPYTMNGYIAKMIPFNAKMKPFNPYRNQGRRVYVSHVEFLVEGRNVDLNVFVYADEEEFPFLFNKVIMTEGTSSKNRQWKTITVNQESNFITFELNQLSQRAQVKILSMRIHAREGGFTSA